MRRARLALLLALLAVVSAASAADKKKPKKTDAQKEAEEKEAIQKQVEQEAPALLDWFWTFWEPKLKITAVDTSHSPELRVRFQVLGWDKDVRNVVPVPELERLIQSADLALATGEQKRPKSFVKFGVGGLPPESGPAAKIIPIDKADVPLDAIVVAAGHGGYRAVDGLEENHKKAVVALLTGLDAARVNLIWHGPMLYTYRAFEGVEGELSRFDESANLCEGARLRAKIDATATLKEGEKPPPLPPCGLLEGLGGKLSDAIGDGTDKSPGIPFRGKHSRLFDIYSPKDACVDLEFTSTAIRNLDLDDVAERTGDHGAFEEALRLMLKYGRPGARKVIILIGDGRDGYLDDDQSCRDKLTEGECAALAKGAEGKAAVEMIRQCVQVKLNGRATAFQERFAARVPTWLALMQSAGIQVHAIAYNMTAPDGTLVSQTYERERLELLALQTGGSYREVVNRPTDATNVAEKLLEELAAERVLMVAADLPSASKGVVQLEIALGEPYDGLVLTSQEWTFGTPFMPSGLWWKLTVYKNQLRQKVGPIWFWVIVVAACLLALVILWMILKLLKKLVMAIVGAILKKGKGAADAAKKAGKGAGDAAKKAGKGVTDAAGKAGKGAVDAAKKSVPKGKG